MGQGAYPLRGGRPGRGGHPCRHDRPRRRALRAVTDLDDAELLPRLLEHGQGAVELLLGVRRHIARTEEGHAVGHGGCDDGVRVDAVLEELLPEIEAGIVLADDDGDDGRLGLADVETEFAEGLHHVVGVVPKLFDMLGLVLHDVESGHRGHHI